MRHDTGKRLTTPVVALAIVVAFQAQSAAAAEPLPPGEEHLKFYVGGIIARFSTTVGINGTTNQGTPIDLQGPTGNKNANNVLLGADWRIGSRHRVSGLFFTTKKTRSVSYNNDIVIGDDTIEAPLTLEGTSRNTFIFANYRYSFVKNDDVELTGLIGLYLNKFKFDINATGTVTGTGGTVSGTKDFEYSPSASVPMPLIGASIDYHVSQSFDLKASLSGLKAKIGNVDGSVYVATVGAEYLFTPNLGIGVAYMHTNANVDINQKNFTGSINWTNDNFLAYALARF